MIKQSILIIPTVAKAVDSDLNLSLHLSLAIAKQLTKMGNKVAFYQPIAGKKQTMLDTDDLNSHGIAIGNSVAYSKALHMIAHSNQDGLMEIIVEEQEKLFTCNDYVIVRGILDEHLGGSINKIIAESLDSSILVTSRDGSDDSNSHLDGINSYIVANLNSFKENNKILGIVLQHGHLEPHDAIQEDSSPTPIVLDLTKNENYETLSQKVSQQFINSLLEKLPSERKISPALFRSNLTKLAQSSIQRIVLPEGDEPRTLKAAVFCQTNKIANCVLLGKKESIDKVCAEIGIKLPDDVEIIDPESIRSNYVERLVELRSSKGMTAEKALLELQDNVFLGTMMLENDDVDGLVSGAVHSTANTIRPSLQVIKTALGSKIVSSCFFMLLPDQVRIYADCAINPNPNAEQLADIAIQSHDTAVAFNIPAKVAMISYSTYGSGTGIDVDLVEAATALVKEKRPDIKVGGPLQFDAATDYSVGKSKAPNCAVAGQATVYVFSSLSVGNAVYKSVQRSAEVLAVGPMLQGLNKPVNDLSRGALVKDIVYTIALTSIQAIARKKNLG